MLKVFRNKLLPIIKKYLPIIFIVLLALFLRTYLLPTRASFDADQEEIAFKAKEILSGNPVLLGPKTSLGGFSIGPGFSYIWAFFSILTKGHPIAGVYASIFLGILTIVGIYFISRKIFSEKVGLILSFIIAFSNSFIAWDQGPWAPSLFHISEIIIFYGLYISKKSKMGIPLIALGLVMAFQSHFAVFLLILPIVIYLLVYKPMISKKTFIVTLLILLIGVLPLLVYDILHNFVNFNRLVSVFSLGVSGVPPSKLKLIYTLIQNSVSVIVVSLPIFLRYAIFILLIGTTVFGIFKDKKYRSLILLFLLFIFVPLIEFMFYSSSFSEYYLMTVVTPFVFILGYLLSKIKNNTLIIIALILFLVQNMRAFINFKRSINLGAKDRVVQKIVEMEGFSGYGVSISTEPGQNFGFSYLFDYYKATPNIPPKSGEEKIFTIIVPPGFDGIEPIFAVDGVGLRWEGI